MIPKECKRLAEVDFPIAVVSAHAAREKSIRHGHPSTLHLWWARRPLASCRAMLLALLLPDPCDEHCPPEFKAKARSILKGITGIAEGDGNLRKALLGFIGDIANWDVANSPRWTSAARDLVKAAHPGETSLVVDPFAGGGSIPLEALRLGCDAFASDLNPVACLILKVMLEDIPRHGPELTEELRRVAAEINTAAETELSEFYPSEPDGARPVVYLWARTVRCETPNCGAEIPLVRSFWLYKTGSQRKALRVKVLRLPGEPPDVALEVFEPKGESEVPGPTVSRAKATCLCCRTVLSPDRVRSQLREQCGGTDVLFDSKGRRIGGARLLAVVLLKPGQQGRFFRTPAQQDYQAFWKAQQRLTEVRRHPLPNGLNPVPDERLPLMSGTFNVPIYGIHRWGDLFNARQNLTLVTLAALISQCRAQRPALLAEALAFALDIFARSCNGNARLRPDASVAPAFGMHALPITWTFPETVPWGTRSEHFQGAVETIVDVLARGSLPLGHPGQTQQSDACTLPLPDESAAVYFTDPPYYFAVPYADLSDFYFVWLKRTLPGHPLLRDPFDAANPLTPKARELCQMAHWDPARYAHKDQTFFESGMAKAFSEGRRILRTDGIGSVVFAHKTTEGWEALLTGISTGKWTITASWPILTEASNRLRARESAALATSVHLVCRPRPEDAPVGDWGDVLRELPKRVRDWMDRLEQEGVHGADLVFACIGPALELFSRYAKVVDAEDRPIPLGGDPLAREPHLRGYLAYVWEVVGRTTLERVLGTAEASARDGSAGALEEDARLTALFLWTLQTTDAKAPPPAVESVEEAPADEDEAEDEEAPKPSGKGFSLVFDVVRRFAQPLGIHLANWEGRIIQTTKGVVRLLPVSERAEQLFGRDGASAVADRIERRTDPARPVQLLLFATEDDRPELVAPRKKGRKKAGAGAPDPALQQAGRVTTLDRVHAAMLLQAGGRTNALRALLKDEIDRGPDFLRLANSLAKLYPDGSEEKRLVQAMLLAVPRR
jgi:adenine-specific DNA methylase